MTLKVRVALQGGGAKLVTLIAAADALTDIANKGKIEITQLAGTSAGSIVACMLATKEPMENYRLRALKAANDVITHFDNRPWITTIAWKLYSGSPIFPEAKVRGFMYELFGDRKLSSLAIPTKIVASSVRNREKHLYDSTLTSEKIAEVVTTSSALPLAFRSYKQTDLYVDGGLVSNFPASELIKNNPDQDSLLGFSFEYEQEDDPDGLLEYLGALASTAIESNVKSSAERITELGGRVCELPNKFSTLEFRKAMNALDGKPYEEAKSLAKARIEETLGLLEQQSKATKRAAGESIDTKMSRIYYSIMNEYPVKSVRSSMFIVANCLKTKVNDSISESDEIIQTVDFRPLHNGGKILAVRLGLATGESIPMSNEKDDIRVIDSSGNEVDVTSMIVEKDRKFYSMLVLDRPITLADDCYLKVIHRTTQQGLMNHLVEYKRAAIRSVCRQDFPMETVDILVALPESSGHVVLSDLYEHIPLLKDEGLPYTQRDVEGHWKKGRPMDDLELGRARDGLWPAGFRVVGWRTEGLELDQFCGTLVQIS